MIQLFLYSSDIVLPLGHADNLAKSQRRNCKFVIEKMPVIEYTEEISRKMGNGFRLYDGRAAETSGGLLIVVEEKDVRFPSPIKFLIIKAKSFTD